MSVLPNRPSMNEIPKNGQYALLAFVALLALAMLWLARVLDESAVRTLGEASASAGPWLAIAIAYFTRRRPIGGWLLCYYAQLYLAIIVTTVFFVSRYQDLAPSAWDSGILYVMFLGSSVPIEVARIFEVILATQLLIQRTPEKLRMLRWVLAAMLIASSVSICIDAFFFPVGQKLIFDGLALGFSIVWLIYFLRARRVRLVFIERSWTIDSSKAKRVFTPEEKRRLNVRTLVVTVSAFLVLLVLMGISMGDKKPDAGIFFVPVFYAAIAALIARSLPLRKRNSESQAEAESRIDRTP